MAALAAVLAVVFGFALPHLPGGTGPAPPEDTAGFSGSNYPVRAIQVVPVAKARGRLVRVRCPSEAAGVSDCWVATLERGGR